MTDEEQPQGLPPALVLNILQQRSARDKELAMHLEAALLTAANQIQQERIAQLTPTDAEPE